MESEMLIGNWKGHTNHE